MKKGRQPTNRRIEYKVKKRVLQLIGSFHQGGTERQAVSLLRSLAADGGFELYVAALRLEGVLLGEIANLEVAGIQEYRLDSFFDVKFLQQVRRFARYLKNNRIDLIHTHDFYSNVFGMAAAKLAGTNARVASKRETHGVRTNSQDAVERISFHLSHIVTVNAEAVRQHLISRSIPPKKIHLVYNGVDAERFSLPFTKASILGFPKGARLVTLVANMRHDVKNVPMFLRVARTVSERVKNVHFVIAGEGDLEHILKSQAVDLGIADVVHFLGRCEDVPRLLAASYVCVLTSKAEGFSSSILEYMAAGRPVVATDVGGASEAVVEGKTGYLVASEDDLEMSLKLIELLNHEEKAKNFGENGRCSVQDSFSNQARLDSINQLYSSLIYRDLS